MHGLINRNPGRAVMGAEPRRLQAGAQLGGYQVLGLIGAGGMGEVYAARDSVLDRRVALKVLPERFSCDSGRLERLTREAQLLASLNHPNIAVIHGLVECGGVRALVLELVEGPTLADRIAGGPLPVGEAIAVGLQIARALEAAHDQGIIHRDLKPSNIKLRSDGTVKVLDFGLAKALDPSQRGAGGEARTLTAPVDTVFGTPPYMSPEQAHGQPADRRADIWAFGCVLYEILTGERPFRGHDPSTMVAAVLSTEPDWSRLPAGVPSGVEMFLRGCLRKEPRRRVRDIGDVRLALEGAFEAPAPKDGGGRGASRSARAAWVAAGLAVAIAAAIAGWKMRPAPDDRSISFQLGPPGGTQFGLASMYPHPALSLDGRQLAFVAPWRSRPVVWVQTLGDPTARRLAGTEDAMFPFWSPDASAIGFSAAGRLQKIAVSGDRAPQELCNCDAFFGGTWRLDGTIVFGRRAGLSRISAGGGEPVALTRVDHSLGEFSHRFPVLLPDGRRFIYLIRSTQEAHRGLYLGALDDLRLKQRIAPVDSNAAIGLGPGRRPFLFFVRDLKLLAQPLDLSLGQLSGEAEVVADQVIPGESGRLAPFAAAGRSVVYRRRAPAQTRLVWRNRRGVPGATIGRAGDEYWFPALSPDGTRLAVARRDPTTDRRDIWAVDIGNGTEERITWDDISAGFPVWAASGSRILFAAPSSGLWDIYSQAAHGGAAVSRLRAVPPVQSDDLSRDITRDGRFLLFTRGSNLWFQSLDGPAPPQLVGRGTHGRISPDEHWLAYTSTEDVERQIYVTTFPQPTQRWRVSPAGGQDAQWRSDGSELYYVAADQSLMAVAARAAAARGTFAGVVPEPLFQGTFDRFSMEFGPAYAPALDGQRFVVLENSRNEPPSLNVTINWAPHRR